MIQSALETRPSFTATPTERTPMRLTLSPFLRASVTASLVHGSAAVEIFRYGYLEVAVSDDRIEQFTVADRNHVTRPG